MNYRQKKFQQAAESYDKVSHIQKEMARDLIGLISQFGGQGKILELGCGTGNLSRQLMQYFPSGNIVLSDISPVMLEQCRNLLAIGEFHGVISWEITDAEKPMSYRDLSLICSNAMVQWFQDLKSHLQYVNDCLVPNGIYLFSGAKGLAKLSQKFQSTRDIKQSATED